MPESVWGTIRWMVAARYDDDMQLSNRRRSFLVDSAIAVAMFALALLSLIGFSDFEGARPVDALGFALIAASHGADDIRWWCSSSLSEVS